MTTFTAEKKAPPPYAPGQLQIAVPRGSQRPQSPTHEQIAQRAFAIYVADRRQQGHCKANWYQAEEQLLHEAEPAPKPEAHFGY